MRKSPIWLGLSCCLAVAALAMMFAHTANAAQCALISRILLGASLISLLALGVTGRERGALTGRWPGVPRKSGVLHGAVF